MRRLAIWTSLVLVGFSLTGSESVARGQEHPLSKVEIAKRGKAATALVVSARSYGTAFCIHSSGYFLTTNRVVQSAGGQSLKIVLNPGLENQHVLPATILRSDRTLDLALLQVETKEKLASLSLGSITELTELAEVVTMGFSSNRRPVPDKAENPPFRVRVLSITSLLRTQGTLARIQLDVNPDLPGGPVLDRYGKVVAVIAASSIDRSSHATPVNQIRDFVSKPNVEFTPPIINRINKHKPVSFKVKAQSLLAPNEPLDVELLLSGKGKERKILMKGEKGIYRAEAVPVTPPPTRDKVPLTVLFEKGSTQGTVPNTKFEVGGQELWLGAVASVQLGEEPEVVMNNGRRVTGPITGLDEIEMNLGEAKLKLRLTRAKTITVSHPDPVTQLDCVVVIRREGEILEQRHQTIPIRERLLTVFPGSDMAFAPDSSRLATVDQGQTIIIWDVQTGKQLCVCKGHTDTIWCLAFSPDGKRLASGSTDKTIKIWDTVTGKPIRTLEGHSTFVASVAFSPDGLRIVSGGSGYHPDRTRRTYGPCVARVWDVLTGQPLMVLKGHKNYLDHVSFSPDGKKIAGSGHDGTIRVWDAKTGELLLTLTQGNYVHACDFSTDGKRLAGASYNNTIKVWDTTTGKLVLDRKHPTKAYSVKYAPGGQHLISTTYSAFHIWIATTGQPILQVAAPTIATRFCVSPDGKRIAGRFMQNQIGIWDVADILATK